MAATGNLKKEDTKMFRKLFLGFVILFLVSFMLGGVGSAAKAQTAPLDQRAIVDQISGEVMKITIKDLTNNANLSIIDGSHHPDYNPNLPHMGSRWVGTQGNRNASQYIADKFAEMGLTPVGDNGTFLQKLSNIGQYSQEPWDSRPFQSVSFEITCADGLPPLLPSFEVSTGKPTGVWTRRQPILGLDYVVDPCSPSSTFTEKDFIVLEKNPNSSQDYTGKLVVIQPWPGFSWGNAGGDAFSRASVFAEIKKRGGLGQFSYYSWIPIDYVFQPINYGGVCFSSIAMIDASTQVGDAIVNQGARCTLSIVKDNRPVDSTAYNVLGMIKAADDSPYKDETILLNAHFDHLGDYPASKTYPYGLIYSGASDDGEGIAALLEIARVFKASGVQPKRNILFAAFNCEEAGVAGSRQFVDSQSQQYLNNIVAYITYDGPESWYGIPQLTIISRIYISGARLSNLFASKAADYGISFDTNYKIRPSGFGTGGDQQVISPGYIPNAEIWWSYWPDYMCQEYQDGRWIPYHTPRDTWELLDPALMALMAKIHAATMLDLAMRDETLVGSFLDK